MSLKFRRDVTATGHSLLILDGPCSGDDFADRAQDIVDHFGMQFVSTAYGLDVLMWIAAIGDAQFCISWDIWCDEVTIMAWESTPDSAMDQLIAKI